MASVLSWLRSWRNFATRRKELPDSPPRPQYPELCRFANGKWAVRRPYTIVRGGYEYASMLHSGEILWWHSEGYANYFATDEARARKVYANAFDFRSDKGKVLLLNGDWI